MTDHTALIAELRERAEWARQELNQAAAECFEKAADALVEAMRDRRIGLTDVLLYDAGYEDGLRKAHKKAPPPLLTTGDQAS